MQTSNRVSKYRFSKYNFRLLSQGKTEDIRETEARGVINALSIVRSFFNHKKLTENGSTVLTMK